MQDMLALLDEAGDRRRSGPSRSALTGYAVDLADELLAPAGVALASPATPPAAAATSRSRTPSCAR